MWPLDGDVMQELEQWSTSTAKLRSLIDKANWADAGCKDFAEHLCEDLQQRIQRCKAHLAKKTYTDREKIWPLDGDVIQELEQWSNSMAKLRPLVDKANCADAGSKDFAEHLCGDLHQRIQRCKAHLVKKLEIAQGKRLQLQVNDPPAAEEIPPRSLNLAEPKPRRIAGKKQQRGDRNGGNIKKIVSRTPNDGHRWRKYGQKKIKNCNYPRIYYRCYEKNCPVQKLVQQSDIEPDQFDITYRGKHTCGNSSSGRQGPDRPGQVQNVVLVVSETREDSNSVHLSRHSFVWFSSSTSVGHINQAQQEQQQSKRKSSLQIEIIQQETRQEQQVDQAQQEQQQPKSTNSLQKVVEIIQQDPQHEQQHGQRLLQLSPRIVHSDEIGLEQYNFSPIPHFQQQLLMFQSQSESPSLELSGLWVYSS